MLSNDEIELEIRQLEGRYVALKTIFADDEATRDSLRKERERMLEKMIALQRKVLLR
ncbi:MAG: hypothetical protein IPN76_14120 [Saprospiraceae bacterium]|nr:hypothetical protein [Saprospiraceae bacterium]